MSGQPHAFGIAWSEAPEVEWERRERQRQAASQHTPDISWGHSMRPRPAPPVYPFLLMAVGALLAAGGMATARADSREMAFLDTLTDSGIQVYDASRAIDVGWGICSAFEVANGQDVAEFIYGNTTYSDVPDLATAQLWVVAAAWNLCPWHYHPERASVVA
jgi:hypothetical protein